MNGEVHYHDFDQLPLQSGVTLSNARIAYKTFGTLNDDKTNVLVMPSFYGGTHEDVEVMISAWDAIDLTKYFVFVPNMMCNGISTSPSNASIPFDRGAFPRISTFDNVACQREILTNILGVRSVEAVIGFSMGGQQAYLWAAAYPDLVKKLAVICGSAKTSLHNQLFLEGAKAALTADAQFADGWYETQPVRGLRAFSKVYLGWGYSQTFFREHGYEALGLQSLDDAMAFIEAYFRKFDANDLLAMLDTWQNHDISDNALFACNFDEALGSIKAKTLLLPCESDLYFRVEDNLLEAQKIFNAEVSPIPSTWGHVAGMGYNPEDNAFIEGELGKLLLSE